MNPSDNWKAHIRALIYPIQFDKDPIKHVDRVLQVVVYRGALGIGPNVYLASVRKALASDVTLSALLPQEHPEEVIRDFISEVERRLAQSCSPSTD